MSPPTFLTLPAEIRQQIYRQIIKEEADLDLASGTHAIIREIKQFDQDRRCLLSSNKQINAEASHIARSTVSLRVCCLSCFDDSCLGAVRRRVHVVKVELDSEVWRDQIVVLKRHLGQIIPHGAVDYFTEGCLDKFRVSSLETVKAIPADINLVRVEVILEIVEHAD